MDLPSIHAGVIALVLSSLLFGPLHSVSEEVIKMTSSEIYNSYYAFAISYKQHILNKLSILNMDARERIGITVPLNSRETTLW